MRSVLYDILRKDAHGAPGWVETVAGVDAAKARILHLAERFPADYLIFHQDTARIVGDFRFRSGGFACAVESTFPDGRPDRKTLSTA